MEQSSGSDPVLEAGIIAFYFMKAGEAKGISVNMMACNEADQIKAPENQEIKLKFYF